MGIGIGTALAVSAAVSAGGAVYSAKQQEDAQDEAKAEQDRLAADARAREQNMLMEEAQNAEPMPVTFGQDDDDEIGSYNDFLTPKKSNNNSVSGLGFASSNNSSGLGF